MSSELVPYVYDAEIVGDVVPLVGGMNPFVEHPAERNPRGLPGEQYVFAFPNGHGASVIRNAFSYGHESGLWELAVLDSDGHVDYTTPITGDILGHLTVKDAAEALRSIAELSPELIA